MERLIICGGGHVSLALAHMTSILDFDITVIDDREEFANKERFPMVSQVLCMGFEEALDQLGSRADDYYVIVTRGHAFDRDCLAHVLRGKYAYAGMIGSKGKVAAVMKSLLSEGFPQEQLDGVHSPIGIKLGGQSPAEVAVSIAAELVAERARIGSMPPPAPSEEPGVLVTIVSKKDSAPRGEGTWMLVRPDGSILGTVGGGAAEHKARQDALKLWNGEDIPTRQVYDLSPNAADLGMVCGGIIEVEFTLRR